MLSLDREPNCILDLSTSPVKPQRLAIVFEHSHCVIWDFQKSKVIYEIPSEEPVHCVAWNEDGDCVVTGTRSGFLHFWDCKKKKKPFCYKSIRPDLDANNMNVTALSSVVWLTTMLVVQGGQAFEDPRQISVLLGEESNTILRIALPHNKVPLQVVYSPVKEEGLFRDSLLILSEEADLFAYSFQGETAHYITDIFGPSEVLCSKLLTVANEGERVIETIDALAPKDPSEVLKGGVVVETPYHMFGLLITTHISGLVRFWSISSARMYNLLNLCLCEEVSAPFFCRSRISYQGITSNVNTRISCIEFSIDSGLMVIGYDMGSFGVWELRGTEFELCTVQKIIEVPILCVYLQQDLLVLGDLDANLTVFKLTTRETVLVSSMRSREKVPQYISITEIRETPGSLIVALSNGRVYVLNLESLQLSARKTPKFDVKSKTPRSSEVKITKILPSLLNPAQVLLCYEKSLHLLDLNSFHEEEAQYWDTPVLQASTFLLKCNEHITLFHIDGTLSVLALPSLLRVWKKNIGLPLEADFRGLHMSFDGRFVITTTAKQLILGWLTFNSEEEEKFLSEPTFFCPVEVRQEAKKKKSFLGRNREFNPSNACMF